MEHIPKLYWHGLEHRESTCSWQRRLGFMNTSILANWPPDSVQLPPHNQQTVNTNGAHGSRAVWLWGSDGCARARGLAGKGGAQGHPGRNRTHWQVWCCGKTPWILDKTETTETRVHMWEGRTTEGRLQTWADKVATRPDGSLYGLIVHWIPTSHRTTHLVHSGQWQTHGTHRYGGQTLKLSCETMGEALCEI